MHSADKSLDRAEDFARRYHWPNNHAPSATSLIVAVQAAVPKKLVLHSVEDHGIRRRLAFVQLSFWLIMQPDYCRTLREWGRFVEARI